MIGRVLVISYLYPPSEEMGAQACAQIARYLPDYGWTPIVLTVRQPHPDRGRQAEGIRRGTEIRTAVLPHPFAMYRALRSWGRSIQVEPVDEGLPDESRRRSRLRYWALSLLAVPDAFTGWIPAAVLAGWRAIRRHRVEHLISSGPPWTSHLVGLMLARLSGLPWTAHFRDPWVMSRVEMARFKPVSAQSRRLEAALERMVVTRADTVVCVTEEHAALLRRVHAQTDASKFVTIPNGFDGVEWEELAGGDRSDAAEGGSFVITYAGTLYDRRTPAPLFRALRALIDAGEVDRERIRIDLLGRCDVADGRRVSDLAAECGLSDCVRLTGPLRRSDALRRMTQSDLLLLLAEGLTLQVPGKTYEYLRAGRPVLALAPEGAVARLLRRTAGTWVIDPADQIGLITALREAYRRWADGTELPAPDPAAVAAFDRRILAGRFAEVFAGGATAAPRPESRPQAGEAR